MGTLRIATSLAVLAAVATGCTSEDDLTTFRVELENVSTEGLLDTTRADGAMPLSPGVFAVYTIDNPLFTPGVAASPALELLAEDGIAAPEHTDLEVGETLIDVAETAPDVVASGLIIGIMDDEPGLAPGATTTFDFVAEEGEELQMVMMLSQTNDWFLAFEPGGLPLFDTFGEPIEGVITAELALYDAGTEVDEQPGLGDDQPLATPGQIDVGDEEALPVATVADRHADGDLFVPDVSDLVRIRIEAVNLDDDDDLLDDDLLD